MTGLSKIYYDDGSSIICLPEDAPRYGVVAIVQKRLDGRYRIAHKADYYLFNGEWLELDTFGLIDYAINKPGKIVIAGRTVSPVIYDEIFNRAKEDIRIEALD